MKIATYNVNGISGRLAMLGPWREMADPDVACLQELKAPQWSFPEGAMRDLGYDAIWLGQSQRNGVAFAKHDLGVVDGVVRSRLGLRITLPLGHADRATRAAINSLTSILASPARAQNCSPTTTGPEPRNTDRRALSDSGSQGERS